METEYLTVRESAEFCRKSESTIRDWRWRGKIPVYRTAGGSILFKRSDLIKRANFQRTVEGVNPEGHPSTSS